jgi:hypothetical protein
MVLMGVHREDGLFIREISNLGLHRFTRNLWEIHDIVQEQLFKSDLISSHMSRLRKHGPVFILTGYLLFCSNQTDFIPNSSLSD